MTRSLLISLLLLSLTVPSFAQDKVSSIPQHFYIGLGEGISKVSVKDELNTSLPYTGINLGTAVEVTKTFKKTFFQARNIFTSGSLSPYQSESTDENSVDSYYENLNFAFYWNVYRNFPLDLYLYAGPSLGGKLGLRINNGEVANSSLTYEAAGSAALTVKAAKYFNIFPTPKDDLKNFKVEGTILLPLASLVFTPPYLGLPEDLIQEGTSMIDLSSNYVGYFSNYFNLEIGLSLTYYLRNRNAVEFSWFRDFTSTQPEVNPVKTLNQYFCIKLLYNLK